MPLGGKKLAVASFVTSRVDRCNSLLAGAPCGRTPVSAQCHSKAHPQEKEVWPHPVIPPYVLHWLPVPFRIEYKLCLLVVQSLHGAAPEKLCDCCTRTHFLTSGLQPLERTGLHVQLMRTYLAIVLSQLLVLDAGTVFLLLFVWLTQWTRSAFKVQLKTHPFAKAYLVQLFVRLPCSGMAAI